MLNDYKDCICFNCLEHKKEAPDCGCESGPVYCPHQCDLCPEKDRCDVPGNPYPYVWEEGCKACEEKCAFFETIRFSDRMDTLKEWPMESCDICGNRVIPGFDVPDKDWEKVIGDENRKTCLPCFDRLAQNKGIKYEILALHFIKWWTKGKSEE